jgi:hypothetical protein
VPKARRSLIPPGKDARYIQGRLKGRHRLACSMHVCGFDNKEIAEKLGLSIPQISNILNSPQAKVEILRLSMKVQADTLDVHARLQLLASPALTVLADQVQNPQMDARVRQKAAFGILDRAGYTPVQKTLHMQAPSIDSDVHERMLEAVKDEEVIEADYELYSEEAELDIDPAFEGEPAVDPEFVFDDDDEPEEGEEDYSEEDGEEEPDLPFAENTLGAPRLPRST